jgi:hypothetical protein
MAEPGRSSYQAKNGVPVLGVSWLVPVWIRSELKTPSMPIQAEEYSGAADAATEGTVQSPPTPVKVVPLAM